MAHQGVIQVFEHLRSFLHLVDTGDDALRCRAAELVETRNGRLYTPCWTYADPEVVIVCEQRRPHGVISLPGFAGATTAACLHVDTGRTHVWSHGGNGRSVRQLLDYALSLGGPLWLIARAR